MLPSLADVLKDDVSLTEELCKSMIKELRLIQKELKEYKEPSDEAENEAAKPPEAGGTTLELTVRWVE